MLGCCTHRHQPLGKAPPAPRRPAAQAGFQQSEKENRPAAPRSKSLNGLRRSNHVSSSRRHEHQEPAPRMAPYGRKPPKRNRMPPTLSQAHGVEASNGLKGRTKLATLEGPLARGPVLPGRLCLAAPLRSPGSGTASVGKQATTRSAWTRRALNPAARPSPGRRRDCCRSRR
jgi:hypothetical protein